MNADEILQMVLEKLYGQGTDFEKVEEIKDFLSELGVALNG